MSKGDIYVIDSVSEFKSEEKKDASIKIVCEYHFKNVISDKSDNFVEQVKVIFQVENLLNLSIHLNSVQVTTGEEPSVPIVDTGLLIPDQNPEEPANWIDYITLTDFGTIPPKGKTQKRDFFYKIVRAIQGPPLPETYTNLLYLFPSYTVDYGNVAQFVYPVQVVRK